MSRSNRNPLLPQHPFAMQVSGPSGSGKTFFVKDLLCDHDTPFDQVFYFYAQSQPLYDELPTGTVFIEGLPETAPEFDQERNNCFVFDDLTDEVANCKWATKLYTAGCHHQNLSVVSLQQKIFANRVQRLQCHHLVMFDFPQDRGAIEPLARQLCPGKVEEFWRMYRDATTPNHGWLLVDMKKDRDPRLRFRRGWRECYIDQCEI